MTCRSPSAAARATRSRRRIARFEKFAARRGAARATPRGPARPRRAVCAARPRGRRRGAPLRRNGRRLPLRRAAGGRPRRSRNSTRCSRVSASCRDEPRAERASCANRAAWLPQRPAVGLAHRGAGPYYGATTINTEEARRCRRSSRALISVSDKTGLLELATALRRHGVEILSTGGTAKSLADAGIPVVQVSDYTGQPEILEGRVKTLVPRIHGGILARRGLASHRREMKAHDILPIDLVVVNLYPFESAAFRDGRHLRARHRKHRHRRSDDGARRREELRRRHGRRRPRGLPGDRRRTRRAARRGAAGDEFRPRPQGLRAHGVLRLGDRRLARHGATRRRRSRSRSRRRTRRRSPCRS